MVHPLPLLAVTPLLSSRLVTVKETGWAAPLWYLGVSAFAAGASLTSGVDEDVLLTLVLGRDELLSCWAFADSGECEVQASPQLNAKTATTNPLLIMCDPSK